MNTLSQASHQWATRPDDERFISLIDLFDHFDLVRSQSKHVVVPSKALNFEPTPDNRGLLVSGPNGTGYAPTHHAFGQLATLAKAPPSYLRTLPSPIAADNLNYGIKFVRDVEDLGLLLQKNGSNVLRCALGPTYGRAAWILVRERRQTSSGPTREAFRVGGPVYGAGRMPPRGHGRTSFAGALPCIRRL